MDNEDSLGGGRAAMKTKTITKNYGTRLGKPSSKKLFLVEQDTSKKKVAPVQAVMSFEKKKPEAETI